MLAELRRWRIADYIRQHVSGVVSIAELSQMLSVSEMTIRRDLALLESRIDPAQGAWRGNRLPDPRG